MISWVISAWRARFISSVRSVDQLARVLGGAAHRGHAGADARRPSTRAARGRSRSRRSRAQPLEDLLGVGLVGDQRARALVALRALVLLVPSTSPRRSAAALARDALRQRRDVAVVDDLDAVEPRSPRPASSACRRRGRSRTGRRPRARGTAPGRAQAAGDLLHRLRLRVAEPTRETEMPTLIAGRTPE
jgi:hypothetical protein